MATYKSKKWIILLLITCFAIFGCKIDWMGGDPVDSSNTDQTDTTGTNDTTDTTDIPATDSLTMTMLATVMAVNGDTLQVETDNGIIFDCTKPDVDPGADPIAVDDTMQLTITFDGSQDLNEWNLTDVTCDQVITP